MLGLNLDSLPRTEISRMTRPITIAHVALLFCGAALHAQQPRPVQRRPPRRSKPNRTNTRGTNCWGRRRRASRFYEVTATTPGAKAYFNPIRKGSTASDEAVYDAMTGEPLHFEVVTGAEAAKDPLMAGADAGGNYIKVQLARLVRRRGKAHPDRQDVQGCEELLREGETIVFNRSLGIRRNKVVLPAGYELVACNVLSQVLSERMGASPSAS